MFNDLQNQLEENKFFLFIIWLNKVDISSLIKDSFYGLKIKNHYSFSYIAPVPKCSIFLFINHLVPCLIKEVWDLGFRKLHAMFSLFIYFSFLFFKCGIPDIVSYFLKLQGSGGVSYPVES